MGKWNNNLHRVDGEEEGKPLSQKKMKAFYSILFLPRLLRVRLIII